MNRNVWTYIQLVASVVNAVFWVVAHVTAPSAGATSDGAAVARTRDQRASTVASRSAAPTDRFIAE